MGGGHYSFDVAREARANNADAFSYEGYATGSNQNGMRKTYSLL